MTDQSKPEDAIPEEDAPVEAPTEPAEGRTTSAGASSEAPEELPYIDDPVSKWWIGIIIAVFALIFAFAIFLGSGGLFGDVLDSGEPDPTAEPTLVASPSPEPTEESTAEPTEESTAEPTEESTLESTAEPTEEPTLEPTAEPTEEPTAEPTEEPTEEPTLEPTAEPTIGPCPTFDPDATLPPDASFPPGVSFPPDASLPPEVPCYTPAPESASPEASPTA